MSARGRTTLAAWLLQMMVRMESSKAKHVSNVHRNSCVHSQWSCEKRVDAQTLANGRNWCGSYKGSLRKEETFKPPGILCNTCR